MFVAVLAVIIVLLYIFLYRPLYAAPLSRLPGPKHLKISRWFILNKARTEQRNHYLQKLHEKYGDVVQIGPNEVALNSLDYMKKIYLGNFPKEFRDNGIGFYSQFGNYGMRNMFSTGDSNNHVRRKKMLQKVYSKSNILQSQQFIKDKIDRCWNAIDSSGNKPIDVYSLFTALAMDVVSGFEYGSRNSTEFVSHVSHSQPFDQKSIFNGFRESSSMWFYTTLAPRLWRLVAWWENIGSSSHNAQEWIYARSQRAYSQLTAEESVNEKNYPLLSVVETMFKSEDSSGGNKSNSPRFTACSEKDDKSMRTIASEIADHIAAGHETTGITLTYICWQLSRPSNRHWQHKLRQECTGVTDLQDIDQLPLLNSVVQEACRLHAAIPGSEPRYVPDNVQLQVTLSDGIQTTLPPGTIVSCQPWSMHQLPVFGADSNKFYPERWLQDHRNGEDAQSYARRLRAMNNCMFTFGQGNRMCLGMHLALLEIKYCIARVYSQYSTDISGKWCGNVMETNCAPIMGAQFVNGVPSHCDVDLMRMADTYTTRPFNDECWLQFHRYGTLVA